jgi:squalene-associated FAD-dependent desaturase
MTARLAVVGGGWAGLAAAVEAVDRGFAVTLFEMAPQLGGRARTVEIDGMALDNGQHILIGAYTATLALMARVGVDAGAALWRQPLALTDSQGRGLQLPPGAPVPSFLRGVLGLRHWPVRARLALLGASARWAVAGFRCDPSWTVARLTAALPAAARQELIEPLCVAALNTPADEASATVFLRVLHDALFAGRGSADLLLPRCSLGELLPQPARRWLAARGARIVLSRRVERLEARGSGWSLDGEPFDAVVLAATSTESARLAQAVAPPWAATAAGLHHEPIVTVYARSAGARLGAPMVALAAAADAPAQFVFDRGRLGGHDGVLAFVASGAQAWVDRGTDATAAATLAQAARQLPAPPGGVLEVLRVITEKRATFRCAPGLQRAPMRIATGLTAAGDHVAGPYPATLEGAVRSGLDAVRALPRHGAG